MLYIFEGADLSGKTYLAEGFAKEKGYPIIKKRLDILGVDKNKLKDSEIERITHFFFESIFPLAKTSNLILDRGLLSSLVFSKFFDRKYDLEYVYKYFLDEEYAKYIKCFFIYTPNSILTKRIQIRDEKFFTLNEIELIQEQYQNTIQFLWLRGCDNIYKFVNDIEGTSEFFDYLEGIGITI